MVEVTWRNECCEDEIYLLCLPHSDELREIDRAQDYWTCAKHEGAAEILAMKHRTMCGSQDGGA